MANLGSLLYQIGRTSSKVGSRVNDAKHLMNGQPEKVLKKAAKREMYKNINKILRGL